MLKGRQVCVSVWTLHVHTCMSVSGSVFHFFITTQNILFPRWSDVKCWSSIKIRVGAVKYIQNLSWERTDKNIR